MRAYDPNSPATRYEPSSSIEREHRKRNAFLKYAETVYTAEEFASLKSDVWLGRVDIRIYDDGIVMMRKFETGGGL